MGTESEVFLHKHAPGVSLLFKGQTMQFHSRINHTVQEVVC